jgi:hypothetical protein
VILTVAELTMIVQIVGAISVLISFIFVVRRISQNTAMIRMGSASDRLQREFDIAQPMIQNREIAELWIKADQDFDSLDSVDQKRMIFYERRAIALWHHVYVLRERKLFADSEWHEAKWMIRHFGQRQANRAAWKIIKEAFEPSFQDFIDDQIKIADKEASSELENGSIR